MENILINFWLALSAGLFAPLGAVCVLPLYPGFLAYLASVTTGKKKSDREISKQIIKLGWMVTAGVITSMFLIGLIFSPL